MINSYPEQINSNSSQGFTLIELVMVIVLVGVLAAFALPKFADLSTDARLASLESLEGAIRSATGVVHSIALLEDKTDCFEDPTVELDGVVVTLRCGYPCPHPSGIATAVATEGNFVWVGGNCGGLLGAVEAQVSDAPDPANCKIRYTSARQTRAPGITRVVSGC